MSISELSFISALIHSYVGVFIATVIYCTWKWRAQRGAP